MLNKHHQTRYFLHVQCHLYHQLAGFISSLWTFLCIYHLVFWEEKNIWILSWWSEFFIRHFKNWLDTFKDLFLFHLNIQKWVYFQEKIYFYRSKKMWELYRLFATNRRNTVWREICGNWIKNITNDIGENKHIGENLLLSNVESKIIDTVNRTYYLQYFFLVILV